MAAPCPLLPVCSVSRGAAALLDGHRVIELKSLLCWTCGQGELLRHWFREVVVLRVAAHLPCSACLRITCSAQLVLLTAAAWFENWRVVDVHWFQCLLNRRWFG
ncbi:hypothetical protein BaRGS_00037384 [Batillaria attramentaria]|uniref:Uncharacterized protein n=1 Tax=Batillaria attramentaria TaxID=370345 RepID=A0ABD0JA17_9CAEN